jgi:transposase-like protein
MQMQRVKYATEFKEEAVKQVIDKGHSDHSSQASNVDLAVNANDASLIRFMLKGLVEGYKLNG